MPISQNDFDDACDEFLLTGETPTIERMRSAIGGGSPGTVGPMLKAWKARRAEEEALRDIPVPGSIADDAALTLARLWKRAMAEATAGHDAMRRDLVAAKAEIAELHEDYLGQLCRMEADLDRAQTDRDAHRTRIETFEAERAALSDRVAQAEADAATATARTDAASADARQARSESAAAEDRTDRMRDERDAARREVSALTAGSTQQIRHMSVELDRITTDRDARRRDVEASQARCSELSDRVEQMDVSLQSTSARSDRLAEDLRRAEGAIVAADARTDRMRDERDAARQEGVDLIRAFGQAMAAPREVVRAEREGMSASNEDPGAGDELSSRTLDLRLDEDRVDCALSPEAPPAGHGSLNARMNAISERLNGADDFAAMEACG